MSILPYNISYSYFSYLKYNLAMESILSFNFFSKCSKHPNSEHIFYKHASLQLLFIHLH